MFENPLNWTKLGRVATPRIDLPWNQTHLSLPTVLPLDDGQVRVYIGGRDYLNRSRVGFFELDLNNLNAEPSFQKEVALDLSELGTFDDNGQRYLAYNVNTCGYAGVGLAICND